MTGSTRRAVPCEFSLEIDLHFGGVERIETHLDGFAGQMRRRFVETVVQQEGAIAAHQAIEAMEEEAAADRWPAGVGGRARYRAASAAAEWCPGRCARRDDRRFRSRPRDGRSTLPARATVWDRGWSGIVRARCESSARSCRGPRADKDGVCTIKVPSEAAMRASCGER